jgi:predicted transcriptional regulator
MGNKIKDSFYSALVKNNKWTGKDLNKCLAYRTKTWLIIQFLNYKWSTKHSWSTTYDQIAYICNCSSKLVEYVVSKLQHDQVIKHERNISKGSNMFKWVFLKIKEITNTLLLSLKFNKIKFDIALNGFVKKEKSELVSWL